MTYFYNIACFSDAFAFVILMVGVGSGVGGGEGSSAGGGVGGSVGSGAGGGDDPDSWDAVFMQVSISSFLLHLSIWFQL